MFRVSTTPIIRSTQNCNYSLRYCAATFLQHGQVLTWPRWREVAAQNIWPVPEAVVTVLCAPVDGCGWHPKHVEWTCRIINRLLCVASRWTIINIYSFYICLRKLWIASIENSTRLFVASVYLIGIVCARLNHSILPFEGTSTVDVASLHGPLSRGVTYNAILLHSSIPAGCTNRSPSVISNYIQLMAFKSVTFL
jgi:hypothetical protein